MTCSLCGHIQKFLILKPKRFLPDMSGGGIFLSVRALSGSNPTFKILADEEGFFSSICNIRSAVLSFASSLTNIHRSQRKASLELFYRFAPSRVQIPLLKFLADEEGFEPPLRDYRKHDFESRAFSLSATHPFCFFLLY